MADDTAERTVKLPHVPSGLRGSHTGSGDERLGPLMPRVKIGKKRRLFRPATRCRASFASFSMHLRRGAGQSAGSSGGSQPPGCGHTSAAPTTTC